MMPLRTAFLGGAALLAALVGPAPAQAGTFIVDVLDVGQGDAILIRGNDKVVLIDAGDRDSRIEEQLHTLGVQRIDLLVATHPHADHIGRMREVIEGFDVRAYRESCQAHTTATYRGVREAAAAKGLVSSADPPPPSAGDECALVGDVFQVGTDATLTVLGPDLGGTGGLLQQGTRSDLNSNSVILLLKHGDVTMLFTGDAEEPTERTLVNNGLQHVDVLKVPHHGSEHSSTAAFLAALHPDYAIISCGTDNRYGHPHAEALERIHATEAMLFRTDLSGDVRVVSDGHRVELFEGPLSELGIDWPVPLLRQAESANRGRGTR